MKKTTGILVALLVALLATAGCSEFDAATDDENDIIVRNTSDHDLFIEVDGLLVALVENDGRGDQVADDVEDGQHRVIAWRDPGQTIIHCEVLTDFLSDGEDFYWYLEKDDKYTGSKSGDC